MVAHYVALSLFFSGNSIRAPKTFFVNSFAFGVDYIQERPEDSEYDGLKLLQTK